MPFREDLQEWQTTEWPPDAPPSVVEFIIKKKGDGAELPGLQPEAAPADHPAGIQALLVGGATVVVGVQHGVCGGGHMKLPPQLLVTCQAEKELVGCSNCGRILYYTPDMDLALVD